MILMFLKNNLNHGHKVESRHFLQIENIHKIIFKHPNNIIRSNQTIKEQNHNVILIINQLKI